MQMLGRETGNIFETTRFEEIPKRSMQTSTITRLSAVFFSENRIRK